jgi:[ribosomal protein S18]-alanine N-acetyltransferase
MSASVALSSFTVRAALAGDAEAMSAIHASCFAKAWDQAVMVQFLCDPACLSLVAAADADQPAQALLIAQAAADEAEILTLAVAPAHRHQGLARGLLGAAVSDLQRRGAKALFLEVEEGNGPALSLYQSFGAVAVGLRPRYYEQGADASILSLAL